MMEFGDWSWPGAAFALGAGLGSVFTARIAQQRLVAKLQSAAAELNKRHAAATTELRAAHLRAQSELEQVRASLKRQLLAAAEGPRAALQRAEERLQLAYAELDRLRGTSTAPSRAATTATHGFEPTELLQRQP